MIELTHQQGYRVAVRVAEIAAVIASEQGCRIVLKCGQIIDVQDDFDAVGAAPGWRIN